MFSAAQVLFEGVKHSDRVERDIRNELNSLRDMDIQVTSTAVVVAPPRANHFSGDPCCLRVRMTIEGFPDVHVNHDPGAGRRHDAQAIAIRDTFRIVRRRLEEALRRRQRPAAL
jgi:hypothetical protein